MLVGFIYKTPLCSQVAGLSVWTARLDAAKVQRVFVLQNLGAFQTGYALRSFRGKVNPEWDFRP